MVLIQVVSGAALPRNESAMAEFSPDNKLQMS